MATIKQWVAGARPRTLPAALAPVIVGTAAAAANRDVEEGTKGANLGLALLALIVSCCLQVGVNYANDYSDGIRGTDEERVGPVRLVGQRLADPANVKLMAFTFFGIGAFVGFALVALSQAWIMIPIGALAILAAWRYTGGDNPYGYRGLGEVYVFIFFGLVATLGTQYTQIGSITAVGVLGAIGVGALASAILVANNLRDIPTDSVTGKTTLAVRLGDTRTRQLYLGLFGVTILCTLLMAIWRPWAPIGLLGLVIAWPGIQAVRSGATGKALIPALGLTGFAELMWAIWLFAPLAR
ncbi:MULTISPECIES: 1,4-dihydroxy-2-naphthoate polyprenyltransferase [Janibacter]|uniref:1,4-dihydroxy-2-naphthoate octaprenyltransferase n=1 Tax=Janibacter indicus TaxID=857417 RepID=A0A1L3MDQ8_9MICO|nr:1,4-dihydroxy-2-naphthoate polyprenyltransferase [Janibacter indicus]APH00484.1 1,4-dihydroxy-2-naphthoate octaprenyltransferase [Janibacter indicus]QOK23274.1 1,4-dihydroxy-2-naphthoate polyprenyltransferase [Janibacter indicus]SMC41314.1 1,4-dihydroxy-2-naphthoate prenyltransferase [Janibacter indicus]